MKKNLLVSTLICLMLTTTVYASIPYDSNPDMSGVKFSDVTNKHWAKSLIYKLSAQKSKIFNGYSDGTFRPDQNMSRAEYITALVRTVGYEPTYDIKASYKDVPSEHWASKYIGMAQQKGIIEAGDYGDTLKPDEIISRFEACKMLINCFDKTKTIANDNTIFMYPKFTDAKSLDQKHKKVVQMLYKAGVLQGYDDSSAGIGRYATRAELAVLIMRFIEGSDKLENYQVTEQDTKERKPFYNTNGEYTTYIDMLPEYTKTVNGWASRNPGLTERINSIEFFYVDKSYTGKYKSVIDKIRKGRKNKGYFKSINTDNADYIAVNVTIKYTGNINEYWSYDSFKLLNAGNIFDDSYKHISFISIFTESYVDSIINRNEDTLGDFTKKNREKTYTIFSTLEKKTTTGKVELVGGRDHPNASDNRCINIIY